MQLMALNALLLFDAIFIFFLFLVSVSCLLYYLPLVPPSRSSSVNFERETDMDLEADVESALDTSSYSSNCGGGGHHHHYQYHHCRVTDDSEELDIEPQSDPQEELQQHHHQHHDDHEIPNDQPQQQQQQQQQQLISSTESENHQQHHVTLTCASSSSAAADHPATHIIMTIPQRKYQNSIRNKGQPPAPIETV